MEYKTTSDKIEEAKARINTNSRGADFEEFVQFVDSCGNAVEQFFDPTPEHPHGSVKRTGSDKIIHINRTVDEEGEPIFFICPFSDTHSIQDCPFVEEAHKH